jgi:hypothetical protein
MSMAFLAVVMARAVATSSTQPKKLGYPSTTAAVSSRVRAATASMSVRPLGSTGATSMSGVPSRPCR